MTQATGYTIFGVGAPTAAANVGLKPVDGAVYYDTAAGFKQYVGNGTAWNATSAASTGFVQGPAVTVVGNIPTWNNLIGSLLADSGIAFSTDGTLAANSDLLSPTQKAVKTYVDAIATGLDVKGSCKLATTAALAANTYANGAAGVGATLTANANGALSIDSVAVTAGDRVLIKDEATGANNGIYTVTAAGSGGTPYVLTRATDFDTAAEVTGGAFTFIEAGTVNFGQGWVLVLTGATVIGTTALTFTQFTGVGDITAGTGLSKTGNTLNNTATAGRLIGVQIITTVGAYTYTATAGTGSVVMELLGAGGGGAGVAQAAGGQVNLGGAGGNGAWLRKRLTANFSGGTGVIGTKGSGGAAGDNPGTAGTNTTFIDSSGAPVTYTAAGGGFGSPRGSFAPPITTGGGAGGAATNGDNNVDGNPAQNGIAPNTAVGWASYSSPGPYGPAGPAAAVASGAGTAGTAAGGKGIGGGGAVSSNAGGGNKAGGNGSDGMAIFWEYSS